jgi:predicted O-methyltransferase YrrM
VGLIVPDAIESYLANLNRAPDQLLAEISRKGVERNLPLVDAEVGALLRVLATALGARRILEIGTAVGYSGIWMAAALPPDGMLMTMELDPARGREAQDNFKAAGLASRVSVIMGDAQRMIAKVAGPFDLIFQDGDKKLYVPMLERLVALLRPGGLLVTDNVLWGGKVVRSAKALAEREDPAKALAEREDDDTRAIKEYNERVASHPALLTAIVPLRDGVSISVKRG